MSDSEITKVLEIPTEIFFPNGILNLDALIKSNEFENAKKLDFSGVETVTDLLFWMLKSILSKNQNFNREDLDYLLLNGCANISIWTLNYLNLFNKRNLFSKPTIKLNERFSCCPRISESLMVSLNFDAQINAQNEQIFDQAKCVLINSNSFNARLSENIFNLNQIKSDKNAFFKYIKLKLSKKKTINFYECSQSNSELFLSEKNLVILTYDANQDEETIKNSVLPRLLIVMVKNVLPVKVLILGVGQTDTNFVLQIHSSVNKALKILEKKLRKSVDLHLKNYLNLNFNLQLELSDILNLAEHIDYLIKILDYGAINIDNYSNKMLLIDNVGLRQETPDSPEYHMNEVNNLITNITSADFAELRSLKAPPSGVQIVAEAMCYLFSKPASYQNFIRLINSPSFINQLKDFDLNSVNEYKLKHVKQYVDMPNFNPDYIAKISKTASVLCHFIRSVYFYCTSQDMDCN
ncbi:dynein heavy chain domain-containing 1-like [Brachionus plicatilis]|uniref:Dynein heavy chain domain-containing 1-like n=1 Tax=Brachionus plicatilis TaxID=10195 RepID=A0A3M7SSJ5_BRAPC|nr:dynein heavy chain domain-containing 1-like [Brachionus plicatilis]